MLAGTAAAAALAASLHRLRSRLELSQGEAPVAARALAHGALRRRRWCRSTSTTTQRFFRSDDAPDEVADQRRAGFMRLAALYRERFAETRDADRARSRTAISDLQFTAAYRVPFQYSRFVRQHLRAGAFVRVVVGRARSPTSTATGSTTSTGSYGVNVFGYDFYKECIDARRRARARRSGPVLGSYHPVVADNVAPAARDLRASTRSRSTCRAPRR